MCLMYRIESFKFQVMLSTHPTPNRNVLKIIEEECEWGMQTGGCSGKHH